MAEPESVNQISENTAAKGAMSTGLAREGVLRRAKTWVLEEGPWWLCSFVFHLVLVLSLALIGGRVIEKIIDEAPSFEEADVQRLAEVPQEIERFEIGETPEDPTELSTETLTLEKPAQLTQEAQYYDDSPVFSEAGGGVAVAASNQPNLGGLGGFDIKALGAGPAVRGKGGVGIGVGTGVHAGTGGQGWGFGGRGAGSRKAMLGSGGGTRQSERAVAGALNWIARHQSRDGGWSLTGFKTRCKDPSCTSEATAGERPAAATAMGLLPFLGAGQTHQSKGRYQPTIYAGISYLIKNQKSDGDLRMGGAMYDHGLATIALCECYGMTNDKMVGRAAQAGLNFIASAQDPVGGGWRYEPRTPGDTSVVGWQIMALKSGQMAYLTVNPMVFEKAKLFLKSASSGTPGRMGIGGLFTYMPDRGSTPTMSAVGLLCSQYLGASRTDPAMIEGTAYLMNNQPNAESRDLYYWYYATQVLHNQPGPDWDTWNRKMRRILIDSQCKGYNCAAGSWDPNVPVADTFGATAGRLYVTSLSTLTLEVYYRYLPLYKLDKEIGAAVGEDAADKPAGAEPAGAEPAGQDAGKNDAGKGADEEDAKAAEKPAE